MKALDNPIPASIPIKGFLFGAILLCSMSVIQKLIAGYNPFLPKGYIIPVLFGGSAGGVIGVYLSKVKVLNKELLLHVDRLESILPICSNCKKIRKPEADPYDNKSWQQIEVYISKRTSSTFSHGICPSCRDELYPDFTNNIQSNKL